MSGYVRSFLVPWARRRGFVPGPGGPGTIPRHLGRGQVRISCGGHPAPILTTAGHLAQTAGIAADLLLGVSGRAGRQARTFTFPRGASLGLYTDGLVERRDRDIDKGIARLCTAVAGASPEAACASAMAALADDGPGQDDITLLVIRSGKLRPRGSGRTTSPTASPRWAMRNCCAAPSTTWS